MLPSGIAESLSKESTFSTMIFNLRTRTGTTAPYRTADSTQNNWRVWDQMEKLWFAMTSMVLKTYLKELTISEMDSMIQPRESFANTTENSGETWNTMKSSGLLKNVDTTLDNSRMILTLMAPRTRSSRRWSSSIRIQLWELPEKNKVTHEV